MEEFKKTNECNKTTLLASKFLFWPKIFPDLYLNILSVKWEECKNTLTLTMAETVEFNVLKWIKLIKNSDEISRNPITDLEAHLAFLHFLNGENEKIATFKFRGFTLIEHLCEMNYDLSDALEHKIVIKYSSSEFVMPVGDDCDEIDQLKDKVLK
jgi:hypothetical protein